MKTNLPDDEIVSRAYATTRDDADAPPAALDDAIRAAARRAVHARPQPVGKNWLTRYRIPLSMAAVMMLTSSLVLVSVRERPNLELDLPQVEAAKKKIAAAETTPATRTQTGSSAGDSGSGNVAPAAARTTNAEVLGRLREATPATNTAPPMPARVAPAKEPGAKNPAGVAREMETRTTNPIANVKIEVQGKTREVSPPGAPRLETAAPAIAVAPPQPSPAKLAAMIAPPPPPAAPVAMAPATSAEVAADARAEMRRATPSAKSSAPPAAAAAPPPPAAPAILAAKPAMAKADSATPARAPVAAKLPVPIGVRGNEGIADKTEPTSAAEWVEQLTTLQRSGNTNALRAALTRFRQRYADFVLPKGLQEFEAAMKIEADKAKAISDSNSPG